MTDLENQEAIEKKRDSARVYNAGLNLLARREHSCTELKQKLVKRFPEPLVHRAVIALQNNGLVSDERFAEALIHSRMGKGYGPRYIAQELLQKGVSKELGQELLARKNSEWVPRAIDAAQKKLRTTPRLAGTFSLEIDDEADAESIREHRQQQFLARQKLSSFLTRRGFASDVVRRAMEDVSPVTN